MLLPTRCPVTRFASVALVLMAACVAGGGTCTNEVAAPSCPQGACGEQVPDAPPRLFIDPPFGLGYDCVTIGCDDERTLTIENRGGGIVRLSLVRLGIETSPDFTVRRADDGPLPFDHTSTVDVLPGAPLQLVVRYAPTDASADSGSVLVDWYDGALDFARAVVTHVELPLSSRTIGSPAALLVEERLSFGFVIAGQQATRDVVIRNTGDGGILEVGPVTMGEGSSNAFGPPSAGDWQEPYFVNPGEEVHIPVAYRPTEAAAALGTLHVRTSDGGHPDLVVGVIGTSLAEPRLQVSATTLSFGTVRAGVTRTERVTVTNVGGAPLSFSPSVTAVGVTLSSADAQVLAPLQSTELSVAWTPTVGGPLSGAVTFSSDDPTQPNLAVTLEGFADAPLLSAAPSTLDFGSVVQNWTTGAQTLLLSNTGTGELTVSSISFEVGSSSQVVLAEVPALPVKLSPGEAPVAVSVFLSASTLGTQRATLLVGTDSVDGPLGTGGVGRLVVTGRVITCDEGCPVAQGEPSCSTGSCAIGSCDDDFHDANFAFVDGCECGEDAKVGGGRRDIEGTCDPGVNIGPLGDDCADVREVRRTDLSLHTGTDVDVFHFEATDDAEFFGCDFGGDSFGVRIALEGSQPGMRLCAVRRASNLGCGGENQRQCVDAASEIYFDGDSQVFGDSDTSHFTVWVEWAPGAAPQCGNYTLYVRGNAG
jgi:hypothetical protein